MSQENVYFFNHQGQRLAGILHGTPNRTAVICLHGMLSDKNGSKNIFLAETLEKEGISTLRFDFAGRGDSEGSLWDLSYSREIEDLDAAISYLVSRGVVEVGLFGSSMGGAVALMAAARDERIIAVVTLAAVGHPEEIAETHPADVKAWRSKGYLETEAGRIGQGFIDDALQHDVVEAVRVLLAPILVLHGEKDTIVSSADAHDIASAARNASLEIVPGADHRFSNPVHMRPAMHRAAEFLKSSLQNHSRGH